MDSLLTAKQVSEMLGVSVSWVYEHSRGTKRPKLPCVPLGGVIRFDRESIVKFIKEIENGAAA